MYQIIKPKNILNPQYIHGDFFSVKGDAVKFLNHHLEILLQFVLGLAIFLIDWLDYEGSVHHAVDVFLC